MCPFSPFFFFFGQDGDIITRDLTLLYKPGCGGREQAGICARLKTNPSLQDLPSILLSNMNSGTAVFLSWRKHGSTTAFWMQLARLTPHCSNRIAALSGKTCGGGLCFYTNKMVQECCSGLKLEFDAGEVYDYKVPAILPLQRVHHCSHCGSDGGSK